MARTALARIMVRLGATQKSASPPDAASRTRVRRRPSARVRVPETALGVGLVAAGVLGSLLWSRQEDTRRVLVAARVIERGESIASDALRWVRTAGDRFAAIESPSSVAGAVAAIRIAPGEPIVASMLADVLSAQPGEVTVAVALDTGDAPVDLAAGDEVAVVIVTEVEPGAAPDVVRLGATARVVTAGDADPMTGMRRVVELTVDESSLAPIAAATDVRLARLPVAGAAS